MIKTIYRANITKDGSFWFIKLPSLENVFTQARNLDEIDVMTRDVVSLMLEIPADSFDLDFIFEDGQ